MQSAIDLTAVAALALITVTVIPSTAMARAPRTQMSATAGVGPESDYPMVVGEAFTVEGKTYVPSDTMNYDAVGYAEAGEGGDLVTGAHRTLPLPSYAEVTSLASGKTILVRMTKRGPMAGPNLVALSSGARAQLGLADSAKAPVRVRRVNPPESERAMLRLGQHAPDRMETPQGLLGVLKRKLGDGSVAVLSESARGAAASPMAGQPAMARPEASKSAVAKVSPPKPAGMAAPKLSAKPQVGPNATVPVVTSALPKPIVAPPTKPSKPAAAKQAAPLSGKVPASVLPQGRQAVQVGAFSSEDRAKTAAGRISAQVSQSGKTWRVRLGPFTDQASADRGLAKARAAGYRDARIVREP